MQRALNLAERARGFTAPNPIVGAVIVKNGKIIGEGWHHGAGLPHAEVEAIRSAGKRSLKGADIYVTVPSSFFLPFITPILNYMDMTYITPM